MKQYGWLTVIIGIMLSVSCLAEDIVRISGSNQNGNIVSVEFLPVSTPNFAENITIRANATDDQDKLSWVNFTLVSPSLYYVINSTNGTYFGEDAKLQGYWNSTKWLINESGAWRYSVQTEDNDTTNITIATYNATVSILDEVYFTPNKIEITIPLNYNYSANISTWTSTRVKLNYSLIYNLDSNYTVKINETEILPNSTQYTQFLLNLSSNSSSEYGAHNTNITLSRSWPTPKNFTLPVSIFISDNYGVLNSTSP